MSGPDHHAELRVRGRREGLGGLDRTLAALRSSPREILNRRTARERFAAGGWRRSPTAKRPQRVVEPWSSFCITSGSKFLSLPRATGQGKSAGVPRSEY
jgi:hypothetical protein